VKVKLKVNVEVEVKMSVHCMQSFIYQWSTSLIHSYQSL